MPTLVHLHDWPDRAVIGTVGRPGQRTFYLQARTGRRTTSVAMEKEWAAVLADKIDLILDELMTEDGNRYSVPAEATPELVDEDPVDQPVEEDFRLGSMRLSWDAATGQVVVEAFPLVEVESEDEAAALEEIEPEEAMILRMPVGSARAFAERARRVVRAGRPLCPRCGEPVDPDGHVCDPGDA
ncbi:DUF3090 domain-containing protein [Cellulomonas sp. C5510]|uniref:DUF3090 domain-containing protein n=1 Tax=Cellulomonas sp. C5510 TaxID=2871170 RepID=UPI001C95CAEC|nr:DUF3090 domain-containing protein [Cellulomonas sp. C5510]QZN86778.1 DUF3090 domain-containing protein [Cellulomonas sp. C5510]